MKCYFCTIKELVGERENTHTFLLKDQTGGVSRSFKSICKGWFDGVEDEAEIDSCGLIWSQDGRAIDFNKSYFKEIPQADFDVLQHYITEL